MISLGSANSGNVDRDSTLHGSDFFDVEHFGNAHFHAEGFRSLGADRYAADGSLELHGVSQPVTLNFSWADGEQPLLSGTATVKRLQFGIGGGDWSDTGLIPDETAISTRVRFTRK